MDHILTKMEQRLARITVFDPCRETWQTTAELHKHGFTVDAIESIAEIQEESPASVIIYRRHGLRGCMNDGFTASTDTNPQLQGC